MMPELLAEALEIQSQSDDPRPLEDSLINIMVRDIGWQEVVRLLERNTTGLKIEAKMMEPTLKCSICGYTAPTTIAAANHASYHAIANGDY